MKRAAAAAKINLSLAIGPTRDDGLHELTSVFQRVDIADRVLVMRVDAAGSAPISVHGFADDTLVREALEAVAGETACDGGFYASVEKHVPVAAGLGGGSADAGVALRLAHNLLDEPLSEERLAELAFELGADVPFFLTAGPKLVAGAGERLSALDLPQDYWVVVALPSDGHKPSTGEIYRRFDEGSGERGYARRRTALLAALGDCTRARDLASLPGNDLAVYAGAESMALASHLAQFGAFRADVSGAGPAVYGLFLHERQARQAMSEFHGARQVWLTVPVW